MSNCPLCEFGFAHVRNHLLHDLAVGNLADEVIEGLLIFPNGKGPEFAGKGLCVKRITDDTASGFQLLQCLEAIPNKSGYDAEMFERKKRDERKIGFSRDGSR